MARIILIEKNGTLKQLTAKDLSEDVLYKKCGLKKADGFERRATWPFTISKGAKIELWSKNSGRAGLENKYELPPPVDTPLYFGTMALVARKCNGDFCDLNVADWEKLYEVLFGDSKYLDESETEEEDELDIVSKSKKTKEGYLKDGFVVDDTSDAVDIEDAADIEDAEDIDTEEYDEGVCGDDDTDDMEVGYNNTEDDIKDKLLNCGGSELEPDDYYYSDND